MPSARSLADARLVLAKGPEAYDGTDASQPECICLVLDINPTQLLFETAFFFFYVTEESWLGKTRNGNV